jgi:uncharacterized membrane protein
VAINERGQILFRGLLDNDFLWQNGKMTGVDSLPGGGDSEAVAINGSGQIVGWSETKSGVKHAVLWTLKRG